MASEQPLKCISKEFDTEPFYFVESNGIDKRYIASFHNKERIKTFLFTFIDDEKELQIRIRDFKDKENPIHFDGRATSDKLKSVIDQYEEFVFHDGFHDFMIRHPQTGDYIAFDEHGLIYLYTTKDYSNALNNLGLSHKSDAKSIQQYPHWHYGPGNRENDLNNLIVALGLYTTN